MWLAEKPSLDWLNIEWLLENRKSCHIVCSKFAKVLHRVGRIQDLNASVDDLRISLYTDVLFNNDFERIAITGNFSCHSWEEIVVETSEVHRRAKLASR